MLSIQEISKMVIGTCEKYDVSKLYLFGSYAKGLATDKSDLDFLLVKEIESDSDLYVGMYVAEELETVFNKDVDLIEYHVLESKNNRERTPGLYEQVMKEKVLVYDKFK